MISQIAAKGKKEITPDRNVTMTYGTNGFVAEVRDSAVRVMSYTYTASC